MKKHSLLESTFKELERFVDKVEEDLINSANISFFEIDPMAQHEGQSGGINANLLSQVSMLPGVYAIWLKEGSNSTLHYIGHTAGKTARTRLVNHFFKKHSRTGSQLLKVKQAVAAGYTVGFTYVALSPPLIRLYVESELINRHQELCIWNVHSKGIKRKKN